MLSLLYLLITRYLHIVSYFTCEIFEVEMYQFYLLLRSVDVLLYTVIILSHKIDFKHTVSSNTK